MGLDLPSVAIYFASFGGLLLLLWRSVTLSEFGLVVLASELPLLLSCCAYPILVEIGLIQPGIEGAAFLDRHSAPGVLAAIHILLYVIGALLGFSFASSVRP